MGRGVRMNGARAVRWNGGVSEVRIVIWRGEVWGEGVRMMVVLMVWEGGEGVEG